MSMEEILDSPSKAIVFGRDCSDEEFELYGERLVEAISYDPRYIIKANRIWSGERSTDKESHFLEAINDYIKYNSLSRFIDSVVLYQVMNGLNLIYEISGDERKEAERLFLNEFKDTLKDGSTQTWANHYCLEEVFSNPKKACTAGARWPEGLFEKYGERLVETTLKNPEHIYWAGKEWIHGRFEKYGDKLVEGLVKSPQHSCWAGEFWRDQRFQTHADRLVEAVAQSIKWSHSTSIRWSDERFDPYADRLIKVISQEWNYIFLSREKWPKGRFEKYQENFVKEINQIYHTDNLDVRSLNLFLDVCQLLSEIHFEEREEAKKVLIHNFEASLEKGNVKPWAEYVIKNFNKGAIGGGNYRMMEVIG